MPNISIMKAYYQALGQAMARGKSREEAMKIAQEAKANRARLNAARAERRRARGRDVI